MNNDSGFVLKAPIYKFFEEQDSENKFKCKSCLKFVTAFGSTSSNLIKHIKYTQVRIGNYDNDPYKNDEISVYYQCNNWDKWRENKIVPLRKLSSTRQIDPDFILSLMTSNSSHP